MLMFSQNGAFIQDGKHQLSQRLSGDGECTAWVCERKQVSVGNSGNAAELCRIRGSATFLT